MQNNLTHLPTGPDPRPPVIGSPAWAAEVRTLKAALAAARVLTRDIAAKATEGPAAFVGVPVYDRESVVMRLAQARGVLVEVREMVDAADKSLRDRLREIAEFETGSGAFPT